MLKSPLPSIETKNGTFFMMVLILSSSPIKMSPNALCLVLDYPIKMGDGIKNILKVR